MSASGPSLSEQIWTLPHSWEHYSRRDGSLGQYPVLDEPGAFTLKLKNFAEGRVEGVIRWTDLQRVLNASDPDVRPRGKRVEPSVRSEDDIARAAARARSAVRSICQKIAADRMVTFTTRATIGLDALLTRFQRFCRSLERKTHTKFLYCAVPEPHKADPDHWHIHVAVAGWFPLAIANPIWWALCFKDDEDHVRNGDIDVSRRKRELGPFEDKVSKLAGYISKYVGKGFGDRFNRKAYWAPRGCRESVRHKILRSADINGALREVSNLLGFDWGSIILMREGCVFPLNDAALWFKLLPDVPRAEIPF